MPQPPPESPRRAWAARLWTAVRPRIAIALVALGAITAGVWMAPWLLLGPRVEATVVVRRDLVQSVVASGHVEAPHRVNVGVQVTGVVKRVPVAEGQHVHAGQVLIELDNSEWSAALAQAEAAVSQAWARLRQLREVQAPVAAQTVRQAEVKLDVPQPPAYLRQDMTVSVDIQVAHRQQAVLVPSDALREADIASAWVLKVEGRRARRQPVRLGLRAGGFAEVLEGLRAGDLVLPAKAQGIASGSRLRAIAVQPPDARAPSP